MVIPNSKLIEMYRTMALIRAFEERMIREYEAGHFPGFIHSYIGQEAIAVGACVHLRPDDYITSTHRGHGHLIAKGGAMDKMVAELFGRSTGYNKGKGGSMHVADMTIGMLGANGINGAGIPIATGCALSAKLRGTDQVTICFFGDGAAGTGAFHEGVNLGSVHKLNIVYVIENNQWFVSARTRDCTNIENLVDRANAYGIPGVMVDGNDVIAVYNVMGEAIARARKGEGPTLVECHTYRLRGHVEGDPQTYKPEQEQRKWERRDPILKCRGELIEMGVLTETSADEINHEAETKMNAAVRFAEQSPYPAPEETLADVYA